MLDVGGIFYGKQQKSDFWTLRRPWNCSSGTD